MDAELEEDYFRWLYSQIGDLDVNDPAKEHWSLALQMHKKEFVWFIPNDDNRIEDGRELRYEFSHETRQKLTPAWHAFDVSVLEVLVALAKRYAFLDDRSTHKCFWELMHNLGLDHFNDKRYNGRAHKQIEEILDRFIWRNYSYSGEGGLFPLESAHEDQRKVELWYQLNSYVLDRY